ncbi:MAG: M15 family peptidase [Halobacteriota archaeon]|nr:M15 family peptidase [Halobacteriota archaeon]
MPKYSEKSKRLLRGCHEDLVVIFYNVIYWTDVRIISGHRGEIEQNRLYAQGKSKVQYPFSKHNEYPSLAVDFAPYPIDWNDHGRFIFVAGRIFQIADQFGIRIRWGGDWDRDEQQVDEKFRDLGHIELVKG